MIYIIVRLEILLRSIRISMCRHIWRMPNLMIRPKHSYIEKCNRCGALYIGQPGTEPKYGFWRYPKEKSKRKHGKILSLLRQYLRSRSLA